MIDSCSLKYIKSSLKKSNKNGLLIILNICFLIIFRLGQILLWSHLLTLFSLCVFLSNNRLLQFGCIDVIISLWCLLDLIFNKLLNEQLTNCPFFFFKATDLQYSLGWQHALDGNDRSTKSQVSVEQPSCIRCNEVSAFLLVHEIAQMYLFHSTYLVFSGSYICSLRLRPIA